MRERKPIGQHYLRWSLRYLDDRNPVKALAFVETGLLKEAMKKNPHQETLAALEKQKGTLSKIPKHP